MTRSHKNKSKWKKNGKKHPRRDDNQNKPVNDNTLAQQETQENVQNNNQIKHNEPQQSLSDDNKSVTPLEPELKQKQENKTGTVKIEPQKIYGDVPEKQKIEPDKKQWNNKPKKFGSKKSDWVLLRMRKFGRNYVCKMNDELDIKLGDICVVDLGRAEDYGKVLEIKNKPKEEEIKNSIVRKIKRLLTDKDKQRIQENKAKEEYAYQKCLRRIADHKLDMKLVGVEYSLDCSRIIFYFTADGRIDFRELVKSLATEFRARIELRQIGVRDESKMLGGLGCCGRQLCCSTFLYNFEPINIRMAKIQRLPLNPSKISGLCGRLHCCLRYEYKFYRKASRGMPREGALVSTKSGEGRIFDINIIKRTVFIFLENGKVLEAPVDEIKILKTQRELEPDKKLVKPMMSEHVDVQELKKLEDIPGADFDDDDDDF